MRSFIAALMFFLVVSGFVVLATDDTVAADKSVGATFLAAVSGGQPGTAMTAVQVDRNDDPVGLFACTAAANDCPLRSAVTLANGDAVPTLITFADHYYIVLSQPLPALTEAQTVIRALPGQEVHINGNGIRGPVFRVTGSQITIEGLRLYGAGPGYANIIISGVARNVTIAGNVIGDDDAPSGNCGQNNLANGGVYVDAVAEPGVALAWIYGNVIECHAGEGITAVTGNVIIGQNSQGTAGQAQHNVIRWNQGHGINLGDSTGNTVRNNLIHDNQAGGLFLVNFNNNVMENEIR